MRMTQICRAHLKGSCQGPCGSLHVKNRPQAEAEIAAKGETETVCAKHLRRKCTAGSKCPWLHVTLAGASPRLVSRSVRAASRVRGGLRDLEAVVGKLDDDRALVAKEWLKTYTELLNSIAESVNASIQSLSAPEE